MYIIIMETKQSNGNEEIMYYVEKIIDGQLMCRHSPYGSWSPVSYIKVTERLITMKNEVDTLREENEKLRSKVQVVKRDDIMNVLKSRIEAEMCDMAQEYGLEHGDVSPEWQLDFDDNMMCFANLMCTWITDNKPNTIVEF